MSMWGEACLGILTVRKRNVVVIPGERQFPAPPRLTPKFKISHQRFPTLNTRKFPKSQNSNTQIPRSKNTLSRNSEKPGKQEETKSKRAREVRKFVNRVQGRVIRNQLAALDEAGYVDGLDFETWRAELTAEAEAMDRESLRILWEEGLPDQIRASLAPYGDRLDATYDPMTSILEMGLVEHD